MAERIPQSQGLRVTFNAKLTSDHYSPATGKTIAITISKNGGTFANPSVGALNATEIASGTYYVDLTGTDTNTLGPLIVIGTAAATDNVYAYFEVVQATAVDLSPVLGSSNPQSTNFLTAVDIGNRALQHVGQDLIDSALGFTEQRKATQQVAFAYPKLRRAELRRNVWRFAIRRQVLRALDTNTMLLAPALWVSTTTYFAGSIVNDENGTAWISLIPNNLGNEPQYSPYWAQYFGPMSVSLYDSTVSYSAGELVYTADGDGTNRVYLSLQTGNSDNPATGTAYSATTTYFKNQVVTYSSVAYMSLIDLNINNTPSSSAAAWASGTTYSIGQAVRGSDGIRYTSVGNGNIGHDPTTDGGVNWTNTGVLVPWASDFVGGEGSIKWLQIGGAEFPMGVTLTTLNILYPIGSGPSTQQSSRNAYRLPAGFLRQAPSDPKAGSTSYLGAEWGLPYSDWLFEGNFIVSAMPGPIMLRFVADMVDVQQMDDMFCEGLGTRIALEVCEPLSQSTAKKQLIASEYEKFMTEARLVNAIEIGSEEPPVDDWIACRS